jgi:hypothetical protein
MSPSRTIDSSKNSDVEVKITGQTFRLPVRIRRELPPGVAGLPYGISPLTGLRLPERGTIERLSEITT